MPIATINAPEHTDAATTVAVVTKATVRAADQLELNARQLGAVLGLSEASISRLRSGDYKLRRAGKDYELALLFIRLFRSLDAIVGGDAETARAWLRNPNTPLGGRPIERIQSIRGLTDAVNYLDARRAIV